MEVRNSLQYQGIAFYIRLFSFVSYQGRIVLKSFSTRQIFNCLVYFFFLNLVILIFIKYLVNVNFFWGGNELNLCIPQLPHFISWAGFLRSSSFSFKQSLFTDALLLFGASFWCQCCPKEFNNQLCQRRGASLRRQHVDTKSHKLGIPTAMQVKKQRQ